MAQDNAEHGGELGTEVGYTAPPSFPQLHAPYWPSQIFWLIIALVALYYVLARIALPRIASTLETRRDAISSDLDRAAEYNQRAEAAMAALDEARRTAQAQAQAIREQAEAETKSQLDAALAAAAERIDAQTAAAEARLQGIRDESGARATEVAMETAEALLQRFSPRPVDMAGVRADVTTRLADRFGG